MMTATPSENVPPYWLETGFSSALTSSTSMELPVETLDEAARHAPIVEVRGRLPDGPPDGEIEYWAARPADFRASYHGSGLPFAHPDMAYDRTPNRGTVPLQNHEFVFRLAVPNSFYVHQGKTLLKPHVLLRRKGSSLEEVHVLPLGDSIPFRSLTHLPDSYPRAVNHPRFFPNLSSSDRVHRSE
jgi:hypothetical protein